MSNSHNSHTAAAVGGARSDPAARSTMLLAIAIACIGAFVLTADTGLVSVALPKIQNGLKIAGSDSSWINNAFTLTVGSFLIMFGRLSDRVGLRRVFVAGCLLAALAGLGCGLAQTGGVLFAARAVQGIAGAMLLASALGVILAVTRTPEDRTLGMALWGMATASAVATGFVVGGLVADQFGWHWVFIANVPILLILAVVSSTKLPAKSPDAKRRSLDVAGALLTVTGIGLMLLAVVQSTTWGWGDSRTLVLLAVGAALLVVFLFVESKSKDPLIPLQTFRIRNVAAGHVAVFMATGATAGIVMTSLYLEPILGYSALKTGLMLLPETFAGVSSAAIAARLVHRFGPKFVVATGLTMCGLAMLWMSTKVRMGGDYGTVLLPLLLLGSGVATSVVSATMAASEAFDKEDEAVSSGTINAFSQVGASVMIAVMFTALYSWFYGHLSAFLLAGAKAEGVGEGQMPVFIAEPFLHGEVRAFRIAGAVMIVSAVVVGSWLTNRRRKITVAQTDEENVLAVSSAAMEASLVP